MSVTRTITIVMHDDQGSRFYDVFEGERYADHLAWDEMLGEIASLTHCLINKSRYHLRTPEEYMARRELWAGTPIVEVIVKPLEIITGEPKK